MSDESNGRDQRDVQQCNICLEGISESAQLNNCRHRFCKRCIMEWANINTVCPLCRQPFTQIICNRNTINVNEGKHLQKVLIICLVFIWICVSEEINNTFD